MTSHSHNRFRQVVINHWARLQEQHRSWIVQRVRESENDFILSVPTDRTSELSRIWNLTRDDLAAETALSKICESLEAIGLAVSIDGEGDSARPTRPRPIRYRWLTTPRVGPLNISEEEREALNWTADQAIQADALSRHGDSIAERIAGVAGRLTCHPLFLQQRDELRAEWEVLVAEVRPELPLVRSIRSPGRQPEVAMPRSDANSQIELFRIDDNLRQFTQNFDSFCDRWALNGFEIWSLPNPRGPHWPVVSLSAEESGSNFQTPWHFPIQDQDGFGSLPRQHHAAAAAQRGFEDLRRWQVAGQLLRIDYWRQVLQSRYANRPRVRNFRTQLLLLLAQFVDLDQDRVRRLLRAIRDLRTGARTSLEGLR